jgi:tetratricopeptide (TPR) repeat protein
MMFDARSLLPLIIIVAGFIAYGNSFSGDFVLDDGKHIVNNPRIREVTPLANTLGGRRPLVDLSLALNYRSGKLDRTGYHVFNLAVHLLAGLVLFGLIRRTLVTENLRTQYGDAAPRLAVIIATLWIVHPLQTQSVTYLIQRAESMTGLFYLLVVYAILRGAHGRYPWIWYTIAVLSCAAGMGTKAVMVTAPLAAVLYDRVFLSRSLVELLRRRGVLYALLMSTWLILGLTGVLGGVLSSANKTATVGFGYRGATGWEYLQTQAGVFLHYFRLATWPQPLCLDYGWKTAHNAWQVVVPGFAILIALYFTIQAILRRSPTGFTAVIFFLVLSPTSSIIPVKDPAFEHRMYLPLAAIITLLVVGGHAILRLMNPIRQGRDTYLHKLVLAVIIVTSIILVTETRRRNTDYHNAATMWADVIVKCPKQARAHLGLGTLFFEQAKIERAAGNADNANRNFVRAERSFKSAIKYRPKYADAQYNLGNAQVELGKLNEAVNSFRRSLQLKSRYSKCQYNLANALKKLGRLDEAVAAYRRTLDIKPDKIAAHINLGNTLKAQGKLDEAIAAYHEALRLNPNYANAHLNLGSALIQVGRLREAAKEFRLTLENKPTDRQKIVAKRALSATLDQLRAAKE